jgi:hypothetical protein
MQQLEQCYKEDKYCGGIRRNRVLHLALFRYNALAFVGGGVEWATEVECLPLCIPSLLCVQ